MMDAMWQQFDEGSDKTEEFIKNFKCDICESTKSIRKVFHYASSIGDPGFFGLSPNANGKIFEVALK